MQAFVTGVLENRYGPSSYIRDKFCISPMVFDGINKYNICNDRVYATLYRSVFPNKQTWQFSVLYSPNS